MKELWQNERSKAGITLGIWLVFILIIFLLASCGNSKKDLPSSEPKSNNTTILYRLDTLLSSNYSFKMTVESADLSYKRVYDVTRSSDEKIGGEIFKGYVEDEKGINKFACSEKVVTEDDVNECPTCGKSAEIGTIITVCNNIFLDHEEEEPSYKYELVDNMKFIKSNTKNLKDNNNNTYSYKTDDKSLKVFDDAKGLITRIIIETSNLVITIEFNYNH